jgi:hypothetical protein
VNLGQAKVYAIQHMNEYSNKGVPISTTDGNYQDYIKRMAPDANTAYQELAKICMIPGKMSIVQNPIVNLLGLHDGFEILQHLPGQDKVFIVKGAKSFSFEVSSQCTVSFDESINGTWTPISGTYYNDTETSFTGSITVPSTVTSFTNYRGLLTITDANNDIRMTFTGTYVFNSKNRALFAYTWPDAQSVPWFRDWVPYSLPSNYMKFSKMMYSYDDRQLNESSDYKLTDNNVIYLNWFLTGQFDVYYWEYPEEITNETEDTFEFKGPPDMQSCIPWFMGAYAIMPERPDIGTQLLNQYYVLKDGLSPTEDTTTTYIQDVTGW